MCVQFNRNLEPSLQLPLLHETRCKLSSMLNPGSLTCFDFSLCVSLSPLYLISSFSNIVLNLLPGNLPEYGTFLLLLCAHSQMTGVLKVETRSYHVMIPCEYISIIADSTCLLNGERYTTLIHSEDYQIGLHLSHCCFI